MTAKELRQAAKNVLGFVNDPPGWTAKIIDSKRLASHVLATVRDDDDEPVTEEWFRRHTGGFVNIDGPTIHHCGRYLTWFNWGIGIYDNDSGAVNLGVMDRGQFRSLCVGLGIVLEEKTC